MNSKISANAKAHEVELLSLDEACLSLKIDGTEHKFDVAKVSPRLASATQQQRDLFEIFASGYGIHWPAIDEDLSIDGLLGVKHSPPFARS